MKRFIAVSMIITGLFVALIGGGIETNGRKGDDGLIEWNCIPIEEEVAGKDDDGLIEWNDFTVEEYS